MSQKTARVLVVDDDRMIRTAMENLLRNAGHAVALAKDGVEGLQVFQDNEFDVVILDMNMPEMDGWTTAAAIRNAGSQVPIIAYSTYALKADEMRAKTAGCTHFLGKPVDAGKLMSTLAEAMGWTTSE